MTQEEVNEMIISVTEITKDKILWRLYEEKLISKEAFEIACNTYFLTMIRPKWWRMQLDKLKKRSPSIDIHSLHLQWLYQSIFDNSQNSAVIANKMNQAIEEVDKILNHALNSKPEGEGDCE